MFRSFSYDILGRYFGMKICLRTISSKTFFATYYNIVLLQTLWSLFEYSWGFIIKSGFRMYGNDKYWNRHPGNRFAIHILETIPLFSRMVFLTILPLCTVSIHFSRAVCNSIVGYTCTVMISRETDLQCNFFTQVLVYYMITINKMYQALEWPQGTFLQLSVLDWGLTSCRCQRSK